MGDAGRNTVPLQISRLAIGTRSFPASRAKDIEEGGCWILELSHESKPES